MSPLKEPIHRHDTFHPLLSIGINDPHISFVSPAPGPRQPAGYCMKVAWCHPCERLMFGSHHITRRERLFPHIVPCFFCSKYVSYYFSVGSQPPLEIPVTQFFKNRRGWLRYNLSSTYNTVLCALKKLVNTYSHLDIDSTILWGMRPYRLTWPNDDPLNDIYLWSKLASDTQSTLLYSGSTMKLQQKGDML